MCTLSSSCCRQAGPWGSRGLRVGFWSSFVRVLRQSVSLEREKERERERAICCGEKNSLDKQMQPRRDHRRRRRLSQQEVEIKEAGGDGG